MRVKKYLSHSEAEELLGERFEEIIKEACVVSTYGDTTSETSVKDAVWQQSIKEQLEEEEKEGIETFFTFSIQIRETHDDYREYLVIKLTNDALEDRYRLSNHYIITSNYPKDYPLDNVTRQWNESLSFPLRRVNSRRSKIDRAFYHK
jgi:hypothetical protein